MSRIGGSVKRAKSPSILHRTLAGVSFDTGDSIMVSTCTSLSAVRLSLLPLSLESVSLFMSDKERKEKITHTHTHVSYLYLIKVSKNLPQGTLLGQS